MNRAFAALLVLGACSRASKPMPPAVAPAPTAAAATPKPDADVCSLVLAAARGAVGQEREDGSVLSAACVHDLATAKGVTYVEAMIQPLPAQTISCEADGWIARIGQAPPTAPTDSVLLIGFADAKRAERTFHARVERADWRKLPEGHFSAPCRSVRGIARAEGGRWSVTMLSEDAPGD